MKNQTPIEKHAIRIELYGHTFDLGIKLGEYHDQSRAVQLIDVDNAEPFAVLSVCLPASRNLKPGEFYMKTWSENAAVSLAMIDDGYVEQVEAPAQESGYVNNIRAYRLTEKSSQHLLD